jgi:hypothetical protein
MEMTTPQATTASTFRKGLAAIEATGKIRYEIVT